MCPHSGLQAFMKGMNILAGDHRQRFFGFRSFSLDVYYIDSSPREPRFALVALRFASEAWPRANLGEARSASNANKPASSWPLKQGRKKCSKHGCDRGTSTVQAALGRTKRKRYVLTFMFKLLGRKSACKTFAGSNEILRWLTPFLGPNMDPKMGSRIGSHFHSFF